ncbi:MAG UNVERIFIED_CONTAM: hypothetical protein LVR18_37985 [Planctomycetaceae bacterium]|jgi:ABC-type transport system involved in cytochrome bd biosynthesis fused ATPase/permease subunit
MDPSEGQVLIDGVDIRELRTIDLRSQMGLVTQETLLFNDTIYENIRYGDSTATRESILEAAERRRRPASSVSCRRGSTLLSETAEGDCRVASGSELHWREQFCGIHRF